MEVFQRILVAENNVPLRSLIEYTLTAAGYQVVGVSTGRDALRVLRMERVDLVVTDVCLPELDGVEVIMRLRADANRVPVIAMSGAITVLDDSSNLLKIARLVGAVRTIQNPFSIDELIGVVRDVLPAQ
jgi:two-component system OmpR family response regulator